MQKSILQYGSDIMTLGIMSMIILLLPICCVDAVGYSYTHFIGPVTGPEHKIRVSDSNFANNDKTQHRGSGINIGSDSGSSDSRFDYIGKPEYEFAYGVEDADAHILHNRNEIRDGDTVKGVYSLIDPDGALRVVKYTADEMNGFQAEVIRNGISSLHGQLQNDYNRVPPSKISSLNYNNFYKPDDHEHQYNQQTQTYLKGDKNVYYPSSNTHPSALNLEQLSQINHENLYSNNQYQTPPHPPIIYHFNQNYDDTDNDDDVNDASSINSDSDYREEHKPQYEVHEKPHNGQNEKKIDDHYDKDSNDHKSNNDINGAGHKNEKHHSKEYDDDYYDDKDSEELEDYEETVHHEATSSESDEYY